MKTLRLHGLIIIFVLIAVASGCKKNLYNDDPNEVIVTVSAGDMGDNNKTFLVVENKRSGAISAGIHQGTNPVLRGNDIVGDLVNLHFVYVSSLEIISYFDVPVGKTVTLPNLYTSNDSVFEENRVNIGFSDLPDFDIATRSARYPGHCHTSGTLEVPCANIGGNTYPAGDNFYVCLQKGRNAGYKLVSIPAVDNYIISLSELNNNMTRYAIPKDPDHNPTIKVDAYGSDGLIGIFNLQYPDADLFPGDSVEVFVPYDLPQMRSFCTRIYNNATGQYSYYFNDHVITKYSFLDVGLSLSYTPGDFPQVATAKNDYDLVKMDMFGDDHVRWTLYAPDPQSFYTPEFPEEVLQSIKNGFHLSNLLSDAQNISFQAIDDSRFGDYGDALECFLKIRDFQNNDYGILFEGKSLYNH